MKNVFPGMFPYVCLATMPLFCRMDWPRKIERYFSWRQKVPAVDANPVDGDHAKATENRAKEETLRSDVSYVSGTLDEETRHEEKGKIDGYYFTGSKEESQESDNGTRLPENAIKASEEDNVSVSEKIPEVRRATKVTRKQKFVVSVLLCHIALQFFLPYSHFISQGYNNWVPGLYGYSWDMMVHTWDTVIVVIKVHDNVSNNFGYLDPEAWVQNNRWTKHGDMVMQYSQCMKDNLIRWREEALSDNRQTEKKEMWMNLTTNFSIYIDIWSSLNGRFQQRVFDPRVDMLTVDWHPFKPISYLMPLLTQYNSFRYEVEKILQHVYSWSNYMDALFVADFPGMYLENYVTADFTNVSLTVLEGEVTYIDEKTQDAVTVLKGNSIPVKTGMSHRVDIKSSYPACYMYTYANGTEKSDNDRKKTPSVINDTLPLLKEVNYQVAAWIRTLFHITNSFLHLVYDFPMVRRVRIKK